MNLTTSAIFAKVTGVFQKSSMISLTELKMVSNKTIRKKILVIDDQVSQCKVIKKLFESYGYFVITRDSPEEGLYLLEWKNFDAIITDLCMPWMNGAEFCRRIRKIKPNILIYALSGYIDSFDSRELGEAGFNGLFSKPIRIELIKNTIENDLKKTEWSFNQVDFFTAESRLRTYSAE